MVKRGDNNFTVSHIPPPPKVLCAAFPMQYHKPIGL